MKKGFTLIELLFVIAIVVILVTFAAVFIDGVKPDRRIPVPGTSGIEVDSSTFQ